MKQIYRLLAAAGCCLIATSSFAQNDFTAYTLSYQMPEGTARSVSMGNAFTALGGDLGAIWINPASSAVFKYHEVSITPSFSTTKTTSNFGGYNTKESKTTFGISNGGAVFTIPTGYNYGLLNVNLGIVYNRQSNFNSSIVASGTNNNSTYMNDLCSYATGIDARDMDMNDSQDPFYTFNAGAWPAVMAWNTSLIDTTATGGPDHYVPNTAGGTLGQYYKKKSYGYNSQTDFNFGFNVNNFLYLGVNVGLANVWNKIEETYSEEALSTFDNGFKYFEQYYHQTTSGTGYNFKFGAIVTPVEFLRLGASISTPTWYYLTDKYYWDMRAKYSDGYDQTINSPEGSFDYKITTPFRYSFGVAAVFPMGTISIDYEGTDYSQMKMHERNGDKGSYSFRDINNDIKKYYKHSDNIRAGFEIMPAKEFAIRGGFQYSNSGRKIFNFENYIGSLGLGYNNPSGFYVDCAYMQQFKKTDAIFDVGDIVASYVYGVNGDKPFRSTTWKLLFTFGYRF